MPERSRDWLERDEVLLRLRERARGLVAARADVAGVSLFGSLAEGRAVRGSDADVLVLLAHSETRWLGVRWGAAWISFATRPEGGPGGSRS